MNTILNTEQFFSQLSKTIKLKLESIDMDECNIYIEESVEMIKFLEGCLSELRTHFLSIENISVQDEITFFKEMKTEALGFLLYFNKVHNIELRRSNASNNIQKEHYEDELLV